MTFLNVPGFWPEGFVAVLEGNDGRVGYDMEGCVINPGGRAVPDRAPMVC